MSVDPYQNCPCGSGKKIKWCCQKVARFVERADQLLESDQVAAAAQAIEDGLAEEPTNLWLRTTKARILLSTHDHDRAYPLLDAILADCPGYRPALFLRLEDQVVHGAATDSVATLQEILEAPPDAEPLQTFGWMGVVGRMLSEVGSNFAAIEHLRRASRIEQFREEVSRYLQPIEATVELPPWLRDSYELRPAPAGESAVAEPWRQAIEHARSARWRAAAKVFETIAAEQPSNAAAHFNLGVCRGWLAEHESAAASLERFARLAADEEDAVHALALAMSLWPRESEQTVEVVRFRFPVRDHSRLIQRLKDHNRFQVRVLDAPTEDGEETAKDEFFLLNRDRLRDAISIDLENAPQVVGLVRTGGTNLELELADVVDDDPRLRLVVEAAGDTVEASSQREVVGAESLSAHRLRRLWGMPQDASQETIFRIRQLANKDTVLHVWPDTPNGWLGNKTPREAADMPVLKRHLRAAVLVEEFPIDTGQYDFDLDQLRSQLGLAPEPTIDADAADVERLPLARLRQVCAAGLSASRLVALFQRSLHFLLTRALLNAAEAIVTRPAEFKEDELVAAFRPLIEFARRRVDRGAAARWLERARAFDADAERPPRAAWDIAEWLASHELDPLEVSVPRLVDLLQTVRDDKAASSELSMLMMRVGLTRLVPHPSDPRKVLFDSRPLEYLIARYGTRQPGALDLSPVGSGPGKIWTPDSDLRAGGSPIVLPGQEPATPQRSKLVIPGA